MIDKEELIQQFRAYLEESGTPPPGEESVDLFRLFTELAALKNEVRIESRQVKEALDRFRDLVAPLQEGLDAARGENQRLKADKGQELRPLLLELLELRDRLAAGLDAGADPPPRKLFQGLCRQERELLAGWRQGQVMLLRRLDQLLAARGVTAVAVLQRPLDPHMARAVAVDHRPDMADGVVVAELRAGFLWRDELLRPAEVVVNRLRGE